MCVGGGVKGRWTPRCSKVTVSLLLSVKFFFRFPSLFWNHLHIYRKRTNNMTKEQELKSIINRLWTLSQTIEELEGIVRKALGPGADFVESKEDFDRVSDKDNAEMTGSLMDEDVLKRIWDSGTVYNWYYKGILFIIEPFNDRKGYGYLVTLPDGRYAKVYFNDVVPDVVDLHSDDLWTFMEARMVGVADGYKASLKEKEIIHVKLDDAKEEGKHITYYGN